MLAPHSLCPAGDELADLGLEDLAWRAWSSAGPAVPLREWLALAEAWRILQSLRQANGNRSAAAQALGIGRRTLYAKLDRLGLSGVGRVWRFRSPPGKMSSGTESR